jgi:predicted acetyltransferase
MTARLVEPDVRFESTYREAMDEFVAEGRDEELRSLPLHATFAAFVRELDEQSRGEGLPPGWVPGTTLWLIDDDRFVAKVEVRHRLTEALRLRGGHVGHAVRPTARRRGYGTLALALASALPVCLSLGLRRILVTCDATNETSRRIIEANGGILEDVVQLSDPVVRTMRYWIDVMARVDRVSD